MAFDQAVNQMAGESGNGFEFMSSAGIDEKDDREYKEFKEDRKWLKN